MKHRNLLAGLLVAGALLAGCSGSGNASSEAPKEVSAACSMEQDLMKMNLDIKAPAKDQKVETTDFYFIIPTKELIDALSDSGLSEDQIKENLKQQEDTMVSMIASQLGVDESDVTVENTEEELKMFINVKDFASVADKLGVQVEEDDMVFEEFVKQLDSAGFTCE